MDRPATLDRCITDTITLRSAVTEDISFLARLYADTRRQEVSAWGWPPEQQAWFLRMQFDAQRRSYQANFPKASDHIVFRDDEPIGRILISRDAEVMRLIDIALIGNQRRLGIGTHLLRNLLEECRTLSCTLHLQVAQGNPALQLYERLGFVQTGGDPMYLQMEWRPTPRQKVVAC